MDDYTSSQLVDWYERIERGILNFGEHVPLANNNESLEAPMLTSHLIDACGLIDSVFRDMTPDIVSGLGVNKKRAECHLPDFCELYSKKLDLVNTRSIMFISPPLTRSPFEDWVDRTTVLPWWKAHNALKHDRLQNIRECTLGRVLDALSALHQVISRRFDLVPMLIRRGWLSTNHYSLDFVINESKAGKLPDVFVVQTKLLVHP